MKLKSFFDLDENTKEQLLEIMETPEFQRWKRERLNEEPEVAPCEPYQE
ncbi:hypothetical protein UFOVP229_29 [uncultured Caudovirales phage]|uniref:Uncharacterized protein n=1 Tax=uncultured Caudovirales phage TaxID=2100421 RepID=A0A6J7WMQ7_9CAUD|nr:hypothetical protein UFOVP229_29 [uncultured Caudovirales phage]